MCPGLPGVGMLGWWSCYGFGCADAEFVFDGCEHAEGRVPPSAVVEDLQVLKQC